MKIEINENIALDNTEIIINCKHMDAEILKIVALLRVMDQKITGVKGDKTFLLDASEILYIDTVDKKTFLYTTDEVYETPLRLYELEERLGRIDFFRASKSTIINFRQIKSLRPDFGGRMLVQMNNNETLSVSRQYVPVIKEKLGF